MSRMFDSYYKFTENRGESLALQGGEDVKMQNRKLFI
jgi:hypothetical protein